MDLTVPRRWLPDRLSRLDRPPADVRPGAPRLVSAPDLPVVPASPVDQRRPNGTRSPQKRTGRICGFGRVSGTPSSPPATRPARSRNAPATPEHTAAMRRLVTEQSRASPPGDDLRSARRRAPAAPARHRLHRDDRRRRGHLPRRRAGGRPARPAVARHRQRRSTSRRGRTDFDFHFDFHFDVGFGFG